MKGYFFKFPKMLWRQIIHEYKEVREIYFTVLSHSEITAAMVQGWGSYHRTCQTLVSPTWFLKHAECKSNRVMEATTQISEGLGSQVTMCGGATVPARCCESEAKDTVETAGRLRC